MTYRGTSQWKKSSRLMVKSVKSLWEKTKLSMWEIWARPELKNWGSSVRRLVRFKWLPFWVFIEITNKQRIYKIRIEVNGWTQVRCLLISFWRWVHNSVVNGVLMVREIFQVREGHPSVLSFYAVRLVEVSCSVLGSTHHHTKHSWPCHSDTLSCPISYCIFGPTAGLALVHQSSLISILLAEVNRYPDTRR